MRVWKYQICLSSLVYVANNMFWYSSPEFCWQLTAIMPVIPWPLRRQLTAELTTQPHTISQTAFHYRPDQATFLQGNNNSSMLGWNDAQTGFGWNLCVTKLKTGSSVRYPSGILLNYEREWKGQLAAQWQENWVTSWSVDWWVNELLATLVFVTCQLWRHLNGFKTPVNINIQLKAKIFIRPQKPCHNFQRLEIDRHIELKCLIRAPSIDRSRTGMYNCVGTIIITTLLVELWREGVVWTICTLSILFNICWRLSLPKIVQFDKKSTTICTCMIKYMIHILSDPYALPMALKEPINNSFSICLWRQIIDCGQLLHLVYEY